MKNMFASKLMVADTISCVFLIPLNHRLPSHASISFAPALKTTTTTTTTATTTTKTTKNNVGYSEWLTTEGFRPKIMGDDKNHVICHKMMVSGSVTLLSSLLIIMKIDN